MQVDGLLVLRFLAEDVADRLDSILADIFKAVTLRQNRTQG
jgi:very-short-patch-repair endonuclease